MPYSQIIDQICARNATYIQYNPILARAVGPAPAIIYAVMHDQLQYLLSPGTATREQIIKNDGWFFYELEYIAAKTVMDKSAISRSIQKLVEVGILEMKRGTDPGNRINYYRELFWTVDMDDYSIHTQNPFSTELHSHNSGVAFSQLPLPYNIKQPRLKNNNAHVDVEKPKSRRVSVPKQDTSKEVDPKFIALAAEWEPKLSKSKITDNQIMRAAKVLQKLVVEFGFSFKEVQLGIEYAYNDTIPSKGGFCWADHFPTITGLTQRNIKSETNTEDIKFQKIHNSRLRSLQNDPEVIYNRRIEAIIRKFWDEPNDEDDVQRCIADIDWFQNRLEAVNSQRTSRNKFAWHEGEPFIKVVEFLIDIEANSKKTFRAVMSGYLEFLQYKFQDGTLSTLYAGHFTKTSEIFRQYLAEDYNTTGRKLVDWQKGDFDE